MHAACAVAVCTVCSEKSIEEGGAPKEVAPEESTESKIPKVELQKDSNPAIQFWNYIKYFGMSIYAQTLKGLYFDVHSNVRCATVGRPCCEVDCDGRRGVAVWQAAWGSHGPSSSIVQQLSCMLEKLLRRSVCVLLLNARRSQKMPPSPPSTSPPR